MRKCEVFQYAAKHSAGSDRERFMERADFFYDYSVSTLLQMPTRTFTRPVVLMLTNGYAHAWFRREGNLGEPKPEVPQDFGKRVPFRPQREIALRRLVAIAGAAALAAAATLVTLLLT